MSLYTKFFIFIHFQIIFDEQYFSKTKTSKIISNDKIGEEGVKIKYVINVIKIKFVPRSQNRKDVDGKHKVQKQQIAILL